MTKPKIMAVVFDLDGTLIFTDQGYAQYIVKQTLMALSQKFKTKYGNINLPSDEQIKMFWYESDRNKIITKVFGVDPEKFWKEYQIHENCDERRKYIDIYEDIGIIDYIRFKGLKTGVVTAAREDIADLELGLIGKQEFDEIIHARREHGFEPKPHPSSLLACLETLGVRPRNALYVGNGLEDVTMGIDAEVRTLLIERPKEYTFPDVSLPKSKPKPKYFLGKTQTLHTIKKYI